MNSDQFIEQDFEQLGLLKGIASEHYPEILDSGIRKNFKPRMILFHEGDTSLETSNRSEEVPGGNGETILVVEDDPGILRITKIMLERLGYAVLTTSMPHKAMQLAREHSERIHLIMVDVAMPQMNGKDWQSKSRRFCLKS
jgi:PleD family two-component response regulator